MKKLLFALFLFVGMKSFGQDMVTEEKSSAWLKISAPAAPKTTTVKKKTTSSAKTTAKKTTTPPKTTTPAVVPKKDDEFNKTNSKVKRFQKS